MNRWSIGRPILTNAIVIVAVVMIFGAGTVTAALVVRSTNIVDGEVKTADLANSAVTNPKIASNAVTGPKIDESTLGIVPNANLLDGKDSTAFVSGPGRVLSGNMPFSWGDGVYIFQSGLAYEIGF